MSAYRVIPYIGIDIDIAAIKANRIDFYIAPNFRIVIAVEIIMQPGFRIKVLPRKAQVIFNVLHQNFSLTERSVTCRPDDRPARIDKLLRRAEMIVLIEEISAIRLLVASSSMWVRRLTTLYT